MLLFQQEEKYVQNSLEQCGSQTVRRDTLVRRFNFQGASQNNLN